ncbi:thioester domain-containing protein [Aeromicrobium wangtongii]|uniref:Thioester domain-containing protein n=1 Tax=Aeromicrobium wangtongii TaxID=2969247 RepID=A0ABY5M1N1_9ACTN|nr:thioester domain-containing protein [Aeromicrobium wangtongii]MCD9198070.1 thioester domain-containing protein [Aeromicrobium wangtongii]UUP12110.1 thioester domain-containing protein [Aeromicrobium wangtongii]
MVFVLLTLSVLVGRPAGAAPEIGDVPVPAADSPFTELRITALTGDLGVTRVSAYVAPDTFDPEGGYPATAPAGSSAVLRGYVGIIPVVDDQGRESLAYCIDLFTSTEAGVTYERGNWAESNVRNLGRVGYILQNYYPTVPDQPAGQPDNVRSGAVQAAIWFFSDNFVVDPAEGELYDLTAAIVADTLANDPVTEPTQPALTISPSTAAAPSTGEIVGPFTVTANGPSTLQLEGVEVFADAAGTQPLAAGATVQPGAQLWARSTDASGDQGFSLRRAETVAANTVYLYDGAVPGRDAAQSLVLAETTELEAVASVRITQFAAGGIAVTKTISGEGAGLQGAIEIRAVCTPPGGGNPIERRATIPARAAEGPHTVTLTGFPAGSECTVTEPENGDNDQVRVTATSIDPGAVTIVEGENAAVAATNRYERGLGRLRLTKRIGGPAAGQQDKIVLTLDCDGPGAGNQFDQTFTIPARTASGNVRVATVRDIPVGTRCQVAESQNGTTETVVLDRPTAIRPGTATIVAEDRTREVVVTNIYREQDNGGGGGGGSGGGDFGGGGGGGVSDSGDLPGAGASESPVVPLTVAIALLLTGGIALAASRQAFSTGARGAQRPA